MFDLDEVLLGEAGEPTRLLAEHVNPAFAKVLRMLGYDVDYVRGEGAYLYDAAGTRYLDALAGFGVFACGRNHPVIRAALARALELELPNLPKMGPPRLAGKLARELLAVATPGLERVFFCNSGAEGVEAAIKFARAATGRERIVHCIKGYHGLTFGALSATAGEEWRRGFGGVLGGFSAVALNDAAALERELEGGDVAGFLVEPIQGKGVHLATDAFLLEAQRLCRRHDTVFIADEVQTGLGRTGRMFACEHAGVEPDVLVVSKALSGGYVPIGAVLARRWIHERVFSSLDRCMVHSSTFGQNDLAMVAGLATLSVLREEHLVENAERMGERLLERLRPLAARYEMVREVRGRGLMVAIELTAPASVALRAAWDLLHRVDRDLFPQAILLPLIQDHHILAQVAGHHMDVIKLIPPLVVGPEEVDRLAAGLEATIAACHRFPGPAWEIGKRLGSQVLRGRRAAS